MNKVVVSLACGVMVVVGSACSGDILGRAGCSKDRDCPPGYACIDKHCEMQCGHDGDPCDDGNPCTVNDVCSIGVCMAGAPLADGASCDKDGDPATRDICLANECVRSTCGDGYLDLGANPPEECDDGNTASNDGCEWNCTYLPPTLTITFPERGATLDGDSEVLVKGVATDVYHGIASLNVNGQAATLASDGTWGYRMAAQYGLNTVEAIATNGVGKLTRRTVAFDYSPAWAPYATPVTDSAKLADALIMRISQQAVDDGDHPCAYQGTTYTCSEVNDIATLGEMTLNNLDLQSSIGGVPVYQRTTTFLTRAYDFSCTNCMSVSGLDVGGQFKLDGNVVITSEIVDLDFNALKLALAAQTGGLTAGVSVDEIVTPPKPGFLMTLRTTARVPVVAKFDKSTLSLSFSGYSGLGLVCFLFFTPGATVADDSPGWMSYVCPHAHGSGPSDVDPLGSLNPRASVDSGLDIGSMVMQSYFNISTAPGGGIKVELVAGSVDFQGSQIDVNPIENLMVDLGTLQVLGTGVPLGSYPLNDLVSGLNTILSDVASVFVNDLQGLLEPAISLLLLNPNDPLSVGELVKKAIEEVAPNGPLTLAPFAGQVAAPQVRVASTITSVSLAAPVSGDLLTGGITPGLDTLFFANKVVQRDPLGTILAADCYGAPEPMPIFPETAPLEDAYHVDALNQGLFVVWWNGGFNIPFENRHLSQPLPADLGVSAFTLTPLFYTAPFLANCDGERLTLQTADVNVAGNFTAANVRHTFQAFVSAKIPVNIGVDNGKPALSRVNAQPWAFVVEVISNPALDPALDPTLESLLQIVLADEILVRYGSTVLNALPEFKLDLSALAPASSAAVLKLDALSSQTNAGYTVFRGDVGP